MKTLFHILVHYRNTPYLNMWPGDPSRLSTAIAYPNSWRVSHPTHLISSDIYYYRGRINNLGTFGNLSNLGKSGNLSDFGSLGSFGKHGIFVNTGNLGNIGNFANIGFFAAISVILTTLAKSAISTTSAKSAMSTISVVLAEWESFQYRHSHNFCQSLHSQQGWRYRQWR